MKRSTIPYVGLLIFCLLILKCSDKVTEPAEETYRYNDDGLLAGVTLAGDEELEFAYDQYYRLTFIDGDGVEAQVTYDDIGYPVRVVDHTGSTQFIRDQFGRPAGVIWKHSPGHLIDYWFDSFGHLRSLSVYSYDRLRENQYYRNQFDKIERQAEATLASFKDQQLAYEDMIHRLRTESALERRNYLEYSVGYRYDQFGKLTRVELDNGHIDYKYFDAGQRIERCLPNGITSTYQYESHGRLESLKHRASGEVIASYEYDYDAAGQPTQIHEYDGHTRRTINVTWDDGGFLRSCNRGGTEGVIEFEYDANGRRLAMSDHIGSRAYEYNRFGQLVTDGQTTLERNDAGRVRAIEWLDQRAELSYDGRGFVNQISSDAGEVELRWGIAGRLISMERNGATSHYLPDVLSDNGMPLAEFDEDGKMKAAYFYGNEMLGLRTADNTNEYFLEDGLGRVRLSVGPSGEVIDRTDWSAFGWPNNTARLPAPVNAYGNWIMPEAGGFVRGGSLYMPELDCVQRPRLISDHVALDYARPFRVRRISSLDLMTARSGQFRTFGIYNPFEDPGQLLSYYARIPLDGWLGIAINMLYDNAALLDPRHGGAADVTYPVSLAYSTTAILMQVGKLLGGTSAPFLSYSVGLAHAPLVWVPLLQVVLDSYWGLVFGYLDLAGRQMEAARFYRMYPRDMYDIEVDGNVTRIRSKPGPHTWPRPQALPASPDGPEWSSPPPFTGLDLDDADDERDRDDDEDRGGGDTSSYAGLPLQGPCPPFCGGGGDGPAFPSKAGAIPGLIDPFDFMEEQLGGVSLDVNAVFMGYLGQIEAAVYDRAHDCLVLVGDQNRTVAGIRPDDLAVALLTVNGIDTIPPQSPQFTLDPNDSTNVDGDLLKAKYFPRPIIAPTEFGRTMFETDYLMKQFSFGVELDSEGKLQERTDTVPGLQNLAVLDKIMPDSGPSRSRLWIVPDTLHLSEDGNCILFGEMTFHVDTRRLKIDPTSESGLSDVGDETEPGAAEFARQFGELYDSVAAREPQFDRLKQLGRIVGLAKWLREAGIPFDKSWAVDELNSHRISFTNTVGTIRANRSDVAEYNTNYAGDTISYSISSTSLSGGVDLDVPIEIHTAPRASLLAKQVTSKLGRSSAGPAFPIQFEGRDLIAVVVPSTASGRKFWTNPREIVVDGTTYAFDANKRIVSTRTSGGGEQSYEYDPDGRLVSIRTADPHADIVRAVGRRLRDGALWDMTDSRGNTTRLVYAAGYLKELIFNGKHFANYDFDPASNKVTVETDGLVEDVTFDHHGWMIGYHQRGNEVDPQEPLGFDYTGSGQLQRLTQGGRTVAEVTFGSDGVTPERLTLPQGNLDYSYDRSGRLAGITTSWGDWLSCEYDGERFNRLSIYGSGRKMTLEMDRDGSVCLIEPDGKMSEMSFSGNRLVAVESENGEALVRVERDNIGNPTELNVTGKPKISVTYGEKYPSVARVRQPTLAPVTPSQSGRRRRRVESERTPSKQGRREDLVQASRLLQDVVIVDLERTAEGDWDLLIADGPGEVRSIEQSVAGELAELLDRTTGEAGRIKDNVDLQLLWENFVADYLSMRMGTGRWMLPNGRTVTYKPVLIFRTAHVQGVFTNLEQIRALNRNFILFGSSTAVDGFGPTLATDLVSKIAAVPAVDPGNILFLVRVPPGVGDAETGLPASWRKAIRSLEDAVGEENVVLDPTKDIFLDAIARRGNDLVVIDVMHTLESGLPMRGGDFITAENVSKGQDLSHIKYMITGPFSCELHLRQGGELERAFRSKGVGLINGHSGQIPAETVLKRLQLLNELIKSGGLEGVPAYNVPDILEQLEPSESEGMMNIGFDFKPERQPEWTNLVV